MTDFAKVYSMAADLLDVAADSLAPDPLDSADPRVGAPGRQYVAHGLPAIDCEQLTVNIASIPVVGSPRLSQQSQGGKAACAMVPIARFVISLYRCVTTPSGTKPIDEAKLDEEAKRLAIDGYALLIGLTQAWAQGSLFPSFPDTPCTAVEWRTGLAVPANSGGYGGFTITLDVEIS